MTLIGSPAPSFTLPDSNGENFTLTPGNGKPIALFFYPKSGSYGCNKEACQFRDAVAEKPTFDPTKAQVVGISSDAVATQKAFVERYKLNYPVLSDVNGEARKAYQVGKALWGFSEARITFVIDGNGIVRDQVEGNFDFSAHSKFAVDWLERLEAESNVSPDSSVTGVDSPDRHSEDAA